MRSKYNMVDHVGQTERMKRKSLKKIYKSNDI